MEKSAVILIDTFTRDITLPNGKVMSPAIPALTLFRLLAVEAGYKMPNILEKREAQIKITFQDRE